MDPAVATLIAVVIGGVLSTGGPVFNDWLKRRRDAKAALRLAARLVVEELAEASSLIEHAAEPESRQYWAHPRSMPTATWNEYRTPIATALDSSHWRIVTSAYDAINNLNWTVEERRSDSQHVGAAIAVRPKDKTRDAWRSIRSAIEVLERAIGVRVLREDADARYVHEDAEAKIWPFGDGDDFDAIAYDSWTQD